MGNMSDAVTTFAKSIPSWFTSVAPQAASAVANTAGAAAPVAAAGAKGGILSAALKAANIGAEALSGASALKMLTSKAPKPPAPPAQPNPASILSNKQPGSGSTLGGTYLGVSGAPTTGTKNLLGQ